MEISDFLQVLFRWIHIIFGIIWIGLLYFFNFVNGPFQATLDGPTKQKVNPELLGRAFFWFRWGAAWTWITGILLLTLVFYHGGLMFNWGTSWSLPAGILIALTFAAPFLYDLLAKQFGKNAKVFGTIGFALIALYSILYIYAGDFSYRSFLIHIGVALGSIMAFNVWYRIWPSQTSILTAVKNGQAPDAALVALAGQRSRHNTYMSVPLFYTMINSHTVGFSGSLFGIDRGLEYTIFFLVVLIGWHLVFQFYKKSAKVTGI